MSIPANTIRKLYDLFPRVPDSIELLFFRNPARNPRKILTRILPSETKDILDICAGSDASAMPIAAAFPKAKLTCIDASEGMLGVFQKRLARTELHNITLHKMSAEHLQLPDGTFDAVLISLVLHELSESDITGILSEAKRVLRLTGKLYLTEWDPPEHGWYRKVKFRILQMNEPPTFPGFIFQDLKPYMERHGFRVEREIKCDYSRILICGKEHGE